MIPFKVVIPARYASTRLPGKPLCDIAGKTMIVRVCEQALAAGAQAIVVATDDARIYQAVEKEGFSVMMTSNHHQSGTERIAEIAEKLRWKDDVIVVNLQGDEPLIPADYIRTVANTLARQTQASVATLAAKIDQVEDIFNPNTVKIVTNHHDYALYFSRAAIPWNRNQFKNGFKKEAVFSTETYLRHIGLYAYRVDFLKRYCLWKPSALEEIESLEQLRILWHGESIVVKTMEKAPEAGVDTVEDLARVQHYFLH
jgi:3-deoxy-manno-octulosonate cytidylyltransferase (CMP-KDO synthetase)